MSNHDVNIAIVISEYNTNITDKLLEGALTTLLESDISEENINVVKVPGAIEIPLIAKLLARSKKYNAIICLGAVIQGETLHHDYVCQQVSQGCLQVMLEFNIPVIFGVLTTKTLKQAIARSSKPNSHKGIEAAKTAITMMALVKTLEPLAALHI